MQLSLREAPLFALMVGMGETYFVADAVRLGASVLELALTVALPLAAGGGGALLALLYLRSFRRRRRGVLAAVIAQVAALAGLVVAEVLDLNTPRRLIAGACLYQMAALAAGMLWNSWYGDLVPAAMRGRYFARRNRRVHGAIFVGLAAGGLTLQFLEPGSASSHSAGGSGFACIFALAALFRLVSGCLLFASPETPFRGLTGARRTLRFFGTERGSRATRLLGLGGVLQVAVYLGAPYFTPFMLSELKFSYLELTLATASVTAAKLLFLPTWGRLIDEQGPRRVYAMALLLVTLVPLPWLLAQGLFVVALAQAFSGASWACYEVAHFAVLLDATFKRTRPPVLVAHTVLNGGGQLIGSLAAAGLFSLLGGSFRSLFFASAIARLVVTLAALPLLPELASSAVAYSRLVLRSIGLRSHGGPVHRPVSNGAEADEPPP